MKIRKAAIEDYEALKRFKILSKKEELKYSETLKPMKDTKKKYLEFLKTDLQRQWRAVFLAEDKGKVAGMIIAKRYNALSISKFERKGYISNLYIDKDYRKGGLGYKLFEKAIGWLKNDQKVEHISVEIHLDNIPAQKLAEKMGFKKYTIKMTREV